MTFHFTSAAMWRAFLLSILFFLPFANCLFQDQLGKFDWYRRGVGLPCAASLHPRKPRLLAVTDANLLTHLHLREGTVQWRHKFDHPISHLYVSHRDNTVFTYTTDDVVRCWSQTDGAIRWERTFGTPPLAMHFLEGDASKMLYLMGETLEVRNGVDGVIWSARIDALSGCDGRHVFSDAAAQMTLISQCRDGRVLLTRFSAESGSDVFTREHVLESAGKMMTGSVMEDHLVIVTETEICISQLIESSKKISCHIKPGSAVLFRKMLLQVDQEKGRATIQELHNGEQKDVITIARYLTHSPSVPTPDLEAIAILKAPDDQGWKVEVYDLLTGSLVHSEDCSFLPADFVPKDIFLGTYARKNATVGFRFLVVGRYGEVVMFQQGQKVWERDESLTGVISTLFVDPPTHGSHHMQTDPMKWIKAQFLTLKVQFQLGAMEEKELLAALKRDLSGKNLEVKDPSGYRKFILVLTKFNSVVALHNGDGRVLWQKKFPQTHSFDGLALWSYAHSEEESPKAMLYRKGRAAAYVLLDAHTGEVLQQESISMPISKIIQLPQPLEQGTTDQSIFLFLDQSNPDAPMGRLLPPLASPELLQSISFWDVETGEGVARGFTLGEVELNANQLQFTTQWNLSFHAPVLSFSERGSNDPVHSYTKVLGDRSLLFKYVNPNTALVVTGEGGEELDDAFIEVFLIDTVTGRILFRQQHESAKGPVHSIISQHWAVYHYWSISNQRFQMSSLEMYDASHRPLTLSDLLLGTLELEQLSSYDPIPVKVFNATFFVSNGVTSLSVTKTQKGITTQLLLMATASDQIYGMSKRFLDPRRPIRPTQESKDERLLPYNEQLPLLPTHYASHHHEILSMKGLVSSPAGLESGTHLFAFGDDLYYTRLQPERGFDTLDEDFNYAFLLLTLLAMLVASVVCHVLVREAKLSRKWK